MAFSHAGQSCRECRRVGKGSSRIVLTVAMAFEMSKRRMGSIVLPRRPCRWLIQYGHTFDVVQWAP